ncbi:MAG: EAL domain-containing protein, partial [Gallionella sp.]|nr:EAL domain-containing protein [Gallionella sp.]
LVSEMLEKYHFNHGCLEVEITESALVDGQQGATSFLSKLRELGVAVAIDDFGTGYSNLSILKRFHIDKLKIDQSFVFDLAKNQTSRQIVEAIIKMAHSLGMSTLAEGVETKEHADMLREMGCDYAQGYFFSRPIAMNELKKLYVPCADGKVYLGDKEFFESH